ncbi:hypothetical protein FRACYDRAFT_160634, partial [Fragilariopsis cylindrus CCMP1102]
NIHEPFLNYSTSKKLQSLVFSLGYLDPVIAQSMYIFKNPIVGGAVHTHQDSTFLYTTPKQTCLGLWLALDDATLTNGCLWIRPKSHLETLRRQFIRNPLLSDNDEFDDDEDEHEDDKDNEIISSSLNFVPVEVKAGDLVVFCGTLDHFSLPNFSDKQRHTFQLHLVEGPNAGITWSPENWLQ